MPLTSPALTSTAVKQAAVRLLHEWLRTWFDGTTKAVGARTGVAFPLLPAARIRFDQGEAGGDASAPLAGAELLVTLLEARHRRFPGLADPGGAEGPTGAQRWEDTVIQFNFRVRDGTLPASNLLADQHADLLRAILATPPCWQDLAAKGIRRLQPAAPVALSDSHFARRQILCRARLEYDLPYERQ